MNNLPQFVVLSAVTLVFAIAVWLLASIGGSNNSEIGSGNIAGKNGETGFLSGLGSFADLILSGDSMKCEFTASSPEGDINGVSYIDGKNERFRMDGSGIEKETYSSFSVISTKEAMYWWAQTEEGIQGMVLPINETVEVKKDSPKQIESESMPSPISMDDNVDYDCSKWKVDESMFTLPSDVEFVDMNNMLGDIFKSTP